jgi:hypothetical protein
VRVLTGHGEFSNGPDAFHPPAIQIEDGGNKRVSRSVVNVSANVVHAYEEYVLAMDTLQILSADDIHHLMHPVSDCIAQVFYLLIWLVCHHPFGIGLFQLDTTFHKDPLFDENPHNIDGIDVSFINQDHAVNRRNWDYTRYGWIMLLGYLIDCRNLEHIN